MDLPGLTRLTPEVPCRHTTIPKVAQSTIAGGLHRWSASAVVWLALSKNRVPLSHTFTIEMSIVGYIWVLYFPTNPAKHVPTWLHLRQATVDLHAPCGQLGHACWGMVISSCPSILMYIWGSPEMGHPQNGLVFKGKYHFKWMMKWGTHWVPYSRNPP